MAQSDPVDSNKQYVLDLGGGVIYKPKYPGADDYIFLPFPIFQASRLYFPGLGHFGGTVSGFSIYPSFDYHGKREASDSPDLAGTNTVDWALEVGAGIAYRWDWLRVYAQARQGFNGYSGQVVETGFDVTARLGDRLRLVAGPRVTWASDDYMSTYFGVTPGEAAASGGGLSLYSAGAGFESAGILARLSYQVSDRTTFHVRAGWQRLIGDAADSPIVAAGDENQFSVGVGVSRRFSFDLFK
jgi:MipA family protein